MHPIRKKIVADESMQPVAVQIDYADWLEVERLLGLQGDADANGKSTVGVTDFNTFAGTLALREEPLDFQRRIREEWA